MSLFAQDGRHTASVRSLTPVKLLQMTRAQLTALLLRQPALAYDLVRLLSPRLQESENATILDLREKNRQLTEAYEQLKAAQAQLMEKERLEHELEIARQIQLSVLPTELPQMPGCDVGACIRRRAPWAAISTTSSRWASDGWAWSWATSATKACRRPSS